MIFHWIVLDLYTYDLHKNAEKPGVISFLSQIFSQKAVDEFIQNLFFRPQQYWHLQSQMISPPSRFVSATTSSQLFNRETSSSPYSRFQSATGCDVHRLNAETSKGNSEVKLGKTIAQTESNIAGVGDSRTASSNGRRRNLKEEFD